MSKELLAERQKTHGDFVKVAHIAERLIQEIQIGPSWGKASPAQREALHMIAHKIARIVSGNPNIKDHWRDIAGYATLAEGDATDV